MSAGLEPRLDASGCCEEPAETPPHVNRPGLPALAYRLGTHGDFLERMLDAVRGGQLDALSTREPDDPTVALMDAWAVVADVLTFYQERIANEGFLRTAGERRSLLELAREIGYELRPGVAAEALLAFTVDDSPGAPPAVHVPERTKVMSVPEPGGLPQTFETVESIDARAERNVMRPLMRRAQPIDRRARRIVLSGVGLRLRVGESMLIKPPGRAPKAVKVHAVAEGDGVTTVDLKPRARVRPFRPAHRDAGEIDPNERIPLDAAAIDAHVVERRWEEGELQAFMASHGWDAGVVMDHLTRRAAAPQTDQGTPEEGVFAFRETLGFFGRSAIRAEDLPVPSGGTAPASWESTTIWSNSATPVATWRSALGVDVVLERPDPRVTAPAWTIFEVPEGGVVKRQAYRIAAAVETSASSFLIAGPALGLVLDEPASPAHTFRMRTTTARVAAEKLQLADLPVETPLRAGTRQILLERMFLGMRPGQRLLLSGERSDPAGVPATEAVVLERIVHENGLTTVHFEDGLRHGYRRHTVTLAGNVARATHGETVEEVLGSGDGASGHQSFALRRPPLTHVSAASATGSASTLELRVDGVLWEEAPSLYGLGPADRRYALRIEDDGTTRVTFGDGRSGARATTGRENVVGRYRTGLGRAGEVGAGRLTLMQTRPIGLSEVTNPLRAADGADPESRDEARANAPRTVRALDRAVSLRDYEDFARGFSGIGKARALALWTPFGEQVVVSVATAGGEELAGDSTLRANLVAALRRFGDPVQRVRVESARVLHFDLAASVRADPALVLADVLARVHAGLERRFGFASRELGSPVSAADVIATIQAQDGVVGVDLDRLHVTGDPSGPAQLTPPAVLPAGLASYRDDGSLTPTDVLVLNPPGAAIGEMAP